MEHEGLVRAIQVISNAGLNITEIITDRHKQNTAWIKRNLPDTSHYFDIWHVSKGKIMPSLLTIFFFTARLNIHQLQDTCRTKSNIYFTD